MSEENNNPHEADLLDAMTLSPAEKQEYIAVAGSPKPADEKTASREDVIEALKTVCDPEIMINIWDMGLVYDIRIADDGNVEIDMTLTAPETLLHPTSCRRRPMPLLWLREPASLPSKSSGSRPGRWSA